MKPHAPKRAPAADLTRAELAERPPYIAPVLPDVETPEYVPVGPAGAEIPALRAQLRSLREENAQLRRELRAALAIVADVAKLAGRARAEGERIEKAMDAGGGGR